MYFSFGDGRLPTADDNDFESTMYGADFMRINNENDFWADKNVQTTVGIFVVGIEAKTAETNYALQSFINSQDIDYKVSAITSGETLEDVSVGAGAYELYQWYNWGARDFEIQVDPTLGEVDVFLNWQSDIDYTHSLISSLPSNKTNSVRYTTVSAGNRGSILVRKADTDAFCYYCFYFISVTPSTYDKARFDITVKKNRDDGEEAEEIVKNRNADNLQEFDLPNGGTSTQFKFILETKDDFQIKIFMEQSKADMYIGLHPEKTNDYLWFEELGIGTKVISISTSDPNFYIGAYYYLTIQSTEPKVKGRVQII
jgi:hypothetical protein